MNEAQRQHEAQIAIRMAEDGPFQFHTDTKARKAKKNSSGSASSGHDDTASSVQSAGQKEDGSLDLIWGATAIAKAIKAPRRKTFYLLEKGMIPAKKIGAQWVTTRSELINFFLKIAEIHRGQ